MYKTFFNTMKLSPIQKKYVNNYYMCRKFLNVNMEVEVMMMPVMLQGDSVDDDNNDYDGVDEWATVERIPDDWLTVERIPDEWVTVKHIPDEQATAERIPDEKEHDERERIPDEQATGEHIATSAYLTSEQLSQAHIPIRTQRVNDERVALD